jgi:hypothetical protein
MDTNTFDIINNVAVIGGRPIEHGEVRCEDFGRHQIRGVHCHFANGHMLSVQFGNLVYASHNADGHAISAEVAIFGPDGEFHPLPEWNDDVLGHQTPDEVWALFRKVEAF